MHGGAKGSGAPTGNKNALKHGMFTKESKELNRRISELLRESEEMLDREVE